MADWLPEDRPKWWSNAGKVLKEPTDWLTGRLRNLILRPILQGVLKVAAVVITAFLTVFLGSDKSLGVSPGSMIGFADIPVWLGAQLVRSAEPLANAVLGAVESLNSAFISAGADIGLPAPIVTGVLLALEFVAAVYVAQYAVTFLASWLGLGPLVNNAFGRIRRLIT